MSKYFNRGLLYQWFNAAKLPIFIGIIAWVIYFDKIVLKTALEVTKMNIANNQSDYLMSANIYYYLVLCIIFIIIYYISTGLNKGNTMAFLSSGPFTKKQIKYNEFIGLIITMFLFVLATIYISVIFYIRNKQVLSIVNGYDKIIILECLKIFFMGILGILYMLIVNTLFSNTTASSIALIIVIPLGLANSLQQIVCITSYIDLGDQENIYSKIEYIKKSMNFGNALFINQISSKQVTYEQLFIESIITVTLIIIAIIIFDVFQNKYKLENWNKIFSSKLSEKIVLMITSTGIASVLSYILVEDYINEFAAVNGILVPLTGVKMIETLGLEITCIIILISMVYYLLKKILNKIV